MLQYLRNIRVNLYKRSRKEIHIGSRESCICRDIKLSSQSESKQWDPIKAWTDHFSLPRRFIPRNGREIVLPTFLLLPDLSTVARPSGGHPQSSAWNNPHPYPILRFIVLWFRVKIAPAKGRIPSNRDEIPPFDCFRVFHPKIGRTIIVIPVGDRIFV